VEHSPLVETTTTTTTTIIIIIIIIIKGKAFPIQAWTGPWGSRRLRLQNFYTIGT
jgi:hypothetical protein